MLDSLSILRCYDSVLFSDMHQYNIPVEAIKMGIERMAHVYKPDTGGLNSDSPETADFNDVAHRCAYLHKYAAFHTAMVRDLLTEAILNNFDCFRDFFFSDTNFKICSIGGGPGSDVIGSLIALQTAFGFFHTSAVVVDCMFNWRHSFFSILKELGSGRYGPFGYNTSSYLNWSYVEANLLKPLTLEVIDSLSEASLITMVKFVSAAACQDSESMMRKILASMKPGAMILFIDNGGGGFNKIFDAAAKSYNFNTIFGPCHKNYEKEILKVKKFGYVSCYKSNVTVHILQKPYQIMPYSDSFGNPHRRVIMNISSQSVLPPTPLLFHPDEDIQPAPLFHPDDDIHPASLLFHPDEGFQQTPLPFHPDEGFHQTPLPFHPDEGFHRTPLPFHSDENTHPTSLLFHSDEDICHNDFRSSIHRIPQILEMNTPNRRKVKIVSTPPANSGSKRRRLKKKKQHGCFPIPNFRHHLATKINKMKAAFRKRNRPIFRL